MRKELDCIEYDPEKEAKHYPRIFNPIMKKPMAFLYKLSPMQIRSKSPPANTAPTLNAENPTTKRYSPRIERFIACEATLKENQPPKSRINIFRPDQRIRIKTELSHNEIRNQYTPSPAIDKNILLLEKVKKGDIEGILSLLAKGPGKSADINYKRQDGWTSLLIACDEGNLKVACTLLKFGADIESTNMFQRTALHISCIKYIHK